MMSMVRVGIVSAGGTGRKRTLPAMLLSDTCKVTAVHSRDEDEARRLGKDFGIKHVYGDLGRMITDAEFDIAVVCSPPFVHPEQLEMLLRAGLPTLCEKPLALSEATALAVQELAEQTSTLVMVAHQLRHQSTYSVIKDIIASGEIGEVVSASLEWNYLLDSASPNAAWKLDPALNGPTCLSDAGVHCIDMAIGLFGPGKVFGAASSRRKSEGVIEACDVLAVHSGVRVRYEVSRLQAAVSNHLVISGEKGEITAPHFFTEQSAPWLKVTAGGEERVVKRTPGNPYRKVVEDFAAAATDPEFVSPGTTVDEAVTACRMIDQAQESLGLAPAVEMSAAGGAELVGPAD
jgi:predicted dehydrogenase